MKRSGTKRKARKRTRFPLWSYALGAAALLAIALVGLGWARRPASLSLPYLTARSIAVMDAESGRFLYEKESDAPCPPASVTKLMTLFLVLDDIERGTLHWDDLCTVTEREARALGSKYGMSPGERFSVRQLVAGTALASGCDCVQCLVRLCAGDEETFVRRMNERAESLNLRGSRFVNSAGLDARGQYMTARDIASLTRALVRAHPEILDFTSAASMNVDGREFRNLNRLAGRDSRVLGMKTGTTDVGGCHLVTLAEKDAKRYIIVLLDSNNEESRFAETETILTALFGE